jgi:hypothetical protein
VTNLRVGVQVLRDCVARAGSLEAGLQYYVGAANLADDGGYVNKVLAEQSNLRRVADGKWVSITVALPGPNSAPVGIKTSATPDASIDLQAASARAESDRVAWVPPPP